MLTDGHPTLPFSEGEAEARALRVARKLAKRRIQVHCFAVGPDAADRPRAAVGIARATGGTYQAVRDLERLEGLGSQVALTEMERLLANLSKVIRSDAVAEWLEAPNPAFDGLKPLEVVERGQIDRLWRMIFYLESGVAS